MSSAGTWTAARLLVPTFLWAVRLALPHWELEPYLLWILAADLAVIGAHIWAIQPLQRADATQFARADSPTKFLLTPVLVAAVMLAFDVAKLLEFAG